MQKVYLTILTKALVEVKGVDILNDWEKVKSKNQERLERLNLPNYKSKGKVFIFDQYCPYSLDVINIEKAFESIKFGMHGTMAAQVMKLIDGDGVKFYGSGYTSNFDEIVDFCIESNIRVINSSIVCSYGKKKEAAIKRFAEWGGIWVSSAGNNDDRGVQFPGSSKYTIGVSATNSEDCNGPEIDVTADSYWYVRNKNEGYFTPFNGTSCAAPVIAGIVRLIIDARPEWKLKEVRNFLKENSTTDMKSLEKYERFFSFPDNFKKEEGEILNKPEKIILHHSATDGGTFESIKKYHIEHNGWNDIGYHYLIETDGSLHEGRKEHVTGAHTIGENSSSIGICLVGNFDKYKPNTKQLDTLNKLLHDILVRYGKLPIYGHNKYANKTCPGTKFPMKEVLTVMHNENQVSDIKGHWAEKDIELVVEEGKMKGYPDGTFQPDKPLTRAEYAHILAEQIRKEK